MPERAAIAHPFATAVGGGDGPHADAAVEADANHADADADADAERRFGGLRRLYGEAGYARLRAASAAVVGIGGVGSWAAEALARSGVAQLVLIDLDHVSVSNINRQVQALVSTVGRAKVDALRDRIADIHPQCTVLSVEDFVTPGNWPALLPTTVDVLIDACDQARAKAVLAAWGLEHRVPVVCVGAAGGKRLPQRVEVEDLASTTHDRLLATVRHRLRKDHGAARSGPIGIRCVFSREPADDASEGSEASEPDDEVPAPANVADAGVAEQASVAPLLNRTATATPTPSATPGAPLACHGYGSSVAVTATFGMVAAGEAIAQLLARASAGA